MQPVHLGCEERLRDNVREKRSVYYKVSAFAPRIVQVVRNESRSVLVEGWDGRDGGKDDCGCS